MKFLIVISIIALSISSGQSPESKFNLQGNSDTLSIPKNSLGFAEYSEVISIDSTPANKVYTFALEWYNKTYKSGKAVIQSADPIGGVIIGKANTQRLVYNNGGIKKDAGYFSYTISIYCKDNKYRYLIENITYNKGDMMLNAGADLAETFPSNWTGLIGDNKQTRREWKSMQKQADSELRLIISDLKSSMEKSRKDSEW